MEMESTIVGAVIGAGVAVSGRIIFDWLHKKGESPVLSTRLEAIERDIESHRKQAVYRDTCETKHQGVNQRFDRIDRALDKIDEKLDSLMRRNP